MQLTPTPRSQELKRFIYEDTMAPQTKNEPNRASRLAGRLDGLAGTIRYDIPDALRAELKELAACAANIGKDAAAKADQTNDKGLAKYQPYWDRRDEIVGAYLDHAPGGCKKNPLACIAKFHGIRIEWYDWKDAPAALVDLAAAGPQLQVEVFGEIGPDAPEGWEPLEPYLLGDNIVVATVSCKATYTRQELLHIILAESDMRFAAEVYSATEVIEALDRLIARGIVTANAEDIADAMEQPLLFVALVIKVFVGENGEHGVADEYDLPGLKAALEDARSDRIAEIEEERAEAAGK